MLPLILVTRSGGRSSVGACSQGGREAGAREGESQEVRGTSQPAWESGHGEGGGGIYNLFRNKVKSSLIEVYIKVQGKFKTRFVFVTAQIILSQPLAKRIAPHIPPPC